MLLGVGVVAKGGHVLVFGGLDKVAGGRGLGVALLPEMAIRAGMLAGLSVIARPLAAPAPRRGIAIVARTSTARGPEFDALAEIAASLAREPRTRRKR